MKMKTILTFLLLVITVGACTTTSEKSVATRKVIDQSPGAEGLPGWAKKSNKVVLLPLPIPEIGVSAQAFTLADA